MHYTAAETETKRRKAPKKGEMMEDGRILHEKLAMGPCRVCSETTHSTLLSCKKFREYIPGQISETKRLPEEVCKLCLETLFTDCQYHRMVCYQDYIYHVSKMNFII